MLCRTCLSYSMGVSVCSQTFKYIQRYIYQTQTPTHTRTCARKHKQTCKDIYQTQTPTHTRTCARKHKQTCKDIYQTQTPRHTRTCAFKHKQTCKDIYQTQTPTHTHVHAHAHAHTNTQRYVSNTDAHTHTYMRIQTQTNMTFICLRASLSVPPSINSVIIHILSPACGLVSKSRGGLDDECKCDCRILRCHQSIIVQIANTRGASTIF
jgi:hypothetical protein